MKLHSVLEAVTERIRERSAPTRAAYLDRIARAAARERGPDRLGCANVAHAFAGIPPNDKFRVVAERAPNLAVVTSYNDMLSAHAPFVRFPDIIKDEARRHGATAQVAAGVPAMCDGVTQGTAGMELSLFSRDTIAMATAVGMPSAASVAKLGPERTATGWPGNSSAAISVSRRPVPSSIPLAQMTSAVVPSRWAFAPRQKSRKYCAGWA